MKGGSYGCSARQQSDQKICDKCGLVWDMDDDDPPDCLTSGEVKQERSRVNIDKIRSTLDLPQVSP